MNISKGRVIACTGRYGVDGYWPAGLGVIHSQEKTKKLISTLLKQNQSNTRGTDSADDLNNLSEDLDLTSSKLDNTEKAKNELVTKIVIHLDLIDFNRSDYNADILDPVYVYLISEFAICAGKNTGEFHTPPQASILLAKLVTSQIKQRKKFLWLNVR